MEKYIINPITGDKILSTEFIVNDYFKIKEENEQLKADYGNKAQVERDLLLEENEQLKKELQKYKSLYENEKEHTDTLKRIIKKIEEYIEELYDNTDDTTCYDIDENCKKDILDLLKEIK